MAAKYENEIKNMLSDVYNGDVELAEYLMKASGATYKSMSDEIEIGINNGVLLNCNFFLLKSY